MSFAAIAFADALDVDFDDCPVCGRHVDACNASDCSEADRPRIDQTAYLDGWDHSAELADDRRDREEVMRG